MRVKAYSQPDSRLKPEGWVPCRLRPRGQYPLGLRLAREPCAVQCRVEGAVARLVNGLGLGLGWVFRATVQCR
eukprot:scaffold113038_cov41-Phaeocystis_antarctica.AAC.3